MALPELFANNFTTTLGAAVTASATTITVAAVAPPALQGVGQFHVAVGSGADLEYMLVTGGAATTTWTVTRGAEGSTAAAHLSGAVVQHVVTAGALAGLALLGSDGKVGGPLGSPLPASVVNAGSIAVPRIDIAGHSIPAAGGSVGGDQNAYPDRLAKALGARSRANVANGGSVACWPTGAGHDGGHSWVLTNFRPPPSSDGNGGYLPHTAVAVVHHGQNDLPMLGSLTPKPWIEAMRTELSRYCSAAVFPDTDGSWTWGTAMGAITNNWGYPGGTAHYCQVTAGASPSTQWGQWACPADYPGNLTIAIGLQVIPGAVGAGGFLTVALTIDGIEYDVVVNLDKNGYADAENGKANGIVLRFGRATEGLGLPVARGGLAIPALTAGAHTIRVAVQAAANNAYFIPCYAQIEADPLDGTLLIVPSLYRAASPTLGGYALWNGWTHGPQAATDPLNDASIATWNALIPGLLADFPGRSLYVDIDTAIGKNPALLSPTDFTHPTNRGHALIARTTHQVILTSGWLTPRVCDGAQTQRFIDGYDGGRWQPLGGAFGTSIGPAFANSWTAAGGPSQRPAVYKSLEGRVYVRGTVANATAGVAAGSVISLVGSNVGYAQGDGAHDCPVVTYNGTAIGTGYLRVDSANGLYFAAGGQVGSGTFNEIHCDYQADA